MIPKLKELWAAIQFFAFMFVGAFVVMAPILLAARVAVLVVSHIRISFEP